jgi:RNA polymerase sigma factor (sigma-70 family)
LRTTVSDLSDDLQIRLTFQDGDGREAVRICEQSSPNVVVMDIAMPQLNGLDAAAQILRHSPEIKVIILSMHADEDYPAIAQLLAEDYTRQLQQRGLRDSYDLLTEREKEVLQLLAEGKSNKEVATALNVSPYTVETHRLHIMQKLDLHNTAEIVLYAVRKKIIS